MKSAILSLNTSVCLFSTAKRSKIVGVALVEKAKFAKFAKFTMKAKNNQIDPFVQVTEENLDAVLQLLERRLPKSANVYNTALMSKMVPSTIKIYTLDDISTNDTWVLCATWREDYGHDYSVSAPNDAVITSQIKEIFSATGAIDWETPYIFPILELPIAKMIADVSSFEKSNGTSVLPHYMLHMDKADALKLDVKLPLGFIEKSLDDETGINFLVDNWKYKLDRTKEYVRRLSNNSPVPNSGIYAVETNEPVSGILWNFSGLLGMLYSSKKYRGQGIAQLCTKKLVKQLAELGFVPASSCETKNIASKAFHEKIGMKVTDERCDVLYSGSSW